MFTIVQVTCQETSIIFQLTQINILFHYCIISFGSHKTSFIFSLCSCNAYHILIPIELRHTCAIKPGYMIHNKLKSHQFYQCLLLFLWLLSINFRVFLILKCLENTKPFQLQDFICATLQVMMKKPIWTHNFYFSFSTTNVSCLTKT